MSADTLATTVVERPPAPARREASARAAPAQTEEPCGLAALDGFRWRAVDPVQPIVKPTRFQRVFRWLIDYNRY